MGANNRCLISSGTYLHVTVLSGKPDGCCKCVLIVTRAIERLRPAGMRWKSRVGTGQAAHSTSAAM